MDLDLVRHALAAAHRHGYGEVEIGQGEASFTARFARTPKAKPISTATSAGPAEDSVKEIKATLVGYWRDAKKEPLTVGRAVKKGDIVGMVEALGIVTDVASKVEGEVVEVLAEPGQPVEYGQVLARVKP